MGTLSKGDLVPLNNATKFFSGAEKKFLEAAAAGGDLKKMANGLTLIAGGLVQFATFTRLAFDEVKRELNAIEGKLGITPAVPRRPK